METNIEDIDREIRHFIYTTIAATALPPTTGQTAGRFDLPVAAVEAAYVRLAEAHHIALAPGTHTLWMAHPFSAVPTNFVTEVGAKRYWGN